MNSQTPKKQISLPELTADGSGIWGGNPGSKISCTKNSPSFSSLPQTATTTPVTNNTKVLSLMGILLVPLLEDWLPIQQTLNQNEWTCLQRTLRCFYGFRVLDENLACDASMTILISFLISLTSSHISTDISAHVAKGGNACCIIRLLSWGIPKWRYPNQWHRKMANWHLWSASHGHSHPPLSDSHHCEWIYLELRAAPQISAEKSMKPNTLFPTEWTSHIWVICVQVKEKVNLITHVLKYSRQTEHQESILMRKTRPRMHTDNKENLSMKAFWQQKNPRRN